MKAYDVRRGGLKGALIALLLAVLLSAPRPALAADTLDVVVDQAKLMKLPEKVATIVVGNPLIADIAIQSGGLVVVTGKGYGSTNVIALDRSGTVLMERSIVVHGPTGPIVSVFRGTERETYSCTPQCSALVALGDTGKDYFDKDTFQELDPFKKAIEQTTTRNAQAATAGAGR